MRTTSWLGLIGGVLIGLGAAQPVLAAGPGTADSNIAAAVVGAGFAVDEAGTSTATSSATAEFIAGALTLDAVPNFHFAAKPIADVISAHDLTLRVDDNARAAATHDGNDDGKAIVSDYRGTGAGWELTASAGAFEGSQPDAILYFMHFNLEGSITGDFIGASQKSSDLLGTDTVMAAAPGEGTGITTWKMDDATVDLFQNPAVRAEAYQAKLDWTLTTAPQP